MGLLVLSQSLNMSPGEARLMELDGAIRIKKGKSQIGTPGKGGTEATRLYPSTQRELHVEKRIDSP
jgi:hypothetical protein